MPENRKYVLEEIEYVLSRALAGWTPEAIAEGFKRDHALYWKHREFTKKQVSYIKNTYKIPPGAIRPYQGPGPQESLAVSPTSRALIMDPISTHHEADQPKREMVASSSITNDNTSESIVPLSSFDATSAVGLTTLHSVTAQTDDDVALNHTAHGRDNLQNFGDVLGTGSGAMNHNVNINNNNSVNVSIQGIGDHLDSTNTNADVSALSAEDQAFFDELMAPVLDNEQVNATQTGGGDLSKTEYPQQKQQVCSSLQAVASASQDLSTGANLLESYQHAQHQVLQEDTAMQSIEGVPSINKDKTNLNDGQAQVAAGLAGGDDAADYLPLVNINATPVPTTNVAQQSIPSAPQSLSTAPGQQPVSLPSFAAGFDVATTNPPPPAGEINNFLHQQPSNNSDGAAFSPFPPSSSHRIDYYFAPHGICPIEGEHGHHRTDGSIIFRTPAKYNASFLAMQQKDGVGYFLGLADGIEEGHKRIEEQRQQWMSLITNNNNNNNNSRAVAVQGTHEVLAQHSFEQAYRRAHNETGALQNRALPAPDPSNIAQSRRLPGWTRHLPHHNEYYDAFTGGTRDYQGINLGPRRPAAPRSNAHLQYGNYGGEGSSSGVRRQQATGQHQYAQLSPPSGEFWHTTEMHDGSLSIRLGPPASASPRAPGPSQDPAHFPTLPADFRNGVGHTGLSGLSSGYITPWAQRGTFVGGGAGDGGSSAYAHAPPPPPPTTHRQMGGDLSQEQLDALATPMYRPSSFWEAQQQTQPQAQPHQQQVAPRQDGSVQHPMQLDGGDLTAAYFPIDDDEEEDEKYFSNDQYNIYDIDEE